MFLASFPRRAMMASLAPPITESRGMRWMASISAQRSSRDPCLGDMAAGDLGVGLTVAGRQARPGAQLPGVAEPGDVADLGGDDRGQHRADAGQLLDHLVAA